MDKKVGPYIKRYVKIFPDNYIIINENTELKDL